MTEQPKIIALIPAYNEERHLAAVVQAASAYLPVWVVDDGSADGTVNVAEAAGARVLRQIPNQGKGAALMRGYRQAVEDGLDAVVMLDADGQHDPTEIPRFLEAFAATGDDLIIGRREFQYMPRVRRTTNTFGTWVFTRILGRPIPDNQSGYRLLSRRMMLAMLTSRETNFEFEVEMIVICIVREFGLGWVPIRTIYGDQKSHIQPLRHVIHFFRMAWQTQQTMSRYWREKKK